MKLSETRPLASIQYLTRPSDRKPYPRQDKPKIHTTPADAKRSEQPERD